MRISQIQKYGVLWRRFLKRRMFEKFNISNKLFSLYYISLNFNENRFWFSMKFCNFTFDFINFCGFQKKTLWFLMKHWNFTFNFINHLVSLKFHHAIFSDFYKSLELFTVLLSFLFNFHHEIFLVISDFFNLKGEIAFV